MTRYLLSDPMTDGFAFDGLGRPVHAPGRQLGAAKRVVSQLAQAAREEYLRGEGYFMNDLTSLVRCDASQETTVIVERAFLGYARGVDDAVQSPFGLYIDVAPSSDISLDGRVIFTKYDVIKAVIGNLGCHEASELVGKTLVGHYNTGNPLLYALSVNVK